ncbi:hypothetical protein niasHS_007122 [Heterodera schachtii]|uniref:DUF4704 domain-containing protein n=1 Tax=Heterodera schachtii TaxID=97005 RepID=A0ABD2JLG8_HETSC
MFKCFNNSILKEETKQAQFLALAVVYFLSVLMFEDFSIVASTIANADSRHLTMHLLEGFISVYKSLLDCSIGVPLLKQLIDSVFLTPTLWVRADATVQMRLYDFLADDLFCVSTNNSLLSPASSIVRRTHTVLTLMHTLKQFYWVVRPTTAPNSAQMAMEPMDRLTVVHIRGCILQIVNRLMFNTVPADVSEKEVSRDEEFQCMLNFVNTVQEDDNLYDVLTQLSNQLANHPAIMVPAFDRKKALCVIFKMISSGNELIRIPTLKMLSYFLCRSTQKRKNEAINQKNLFHLLTEKLLLNCRSLSLATYNALFEMLVEQICPEILFVKHEDPPVDSTRFENHQLLKVIAQLLCQSEECAELIRVKSVFLRDVIRLCEVSRDNRRFVLFSPFAFDNHSCFSTSKGLGYFCYFMGNCLVLRCVRAPGKETLHCVKHELLPRKWHHVALSFVYSRWAKSEIHCFVDGYLVEAFDANWLVSTNDHFDRCFVGCGSQPNVNEAFSGQMAAVYLFSQAISPPLVTALLYLGVSYQSQFKHEAESNLPDTYRKNCHDQLCLFQQQTPKGGQLHSSAASYFVQVPHAVMKNGVKLVKTHSVHCSLHSIGGIQVLLPLFSQIDAKQHEPVDNDICANLLSVVTILLSCSTTAQQQFLHVQGFSIVASTIANADSRHLTMNLLEGFISVYKSLLDCSIGVPLLKQLIDSVFLTPTLWVRADATVQMRLYDFLADDLFCVSTNNSLLSPASSIVRRTHTVLTLMHTLKQFYWVVRPTTAPNSAQMAMEPMDRLTVVHIRGCILQIVNRLMFNTVPADVSEKEVSRDEEFQCMLNFVNTVQEDDNLYDVLTQLSNQLANHPAIMVPAFDRKKALCVIFKMISSGNELIRIPTLKMLSYFLCRSTQKRKNEAINQKNLFHLLTEKLLLNCRSLSLATYNALFEMLVEQICPEILFVKHEDPPVDSTRFENHQLLKVIAQLLCQSEECAELIRVKSVFLRDVTRLCEVSRDNRRFVLIHFALALYRTPDFTWSPCACSIDRVAFLRQPNSSPFSVSPIPRFFHCQPNSSPLSLSPIPRFFHCQPNSSPLSLSPIPRLSLSAQFLLHRFFSFRFTLVYNWEHVADFQHRDEAIAFVLGGAEQYDYYYSRDQGDRHYFRCLQNLCPNRKMVRFWFGNYCAMEANEHEHGQ